MIDPLPVRASGLVGVPADFPSQYHHHHHPVAMDYSAIAQDPVGASPWGSPQADEATFPSFTDIPPAPLPADQSPLGESDQGDDPAKGVTDKLQNAHLDEADSPVEQQQPSPALQGQNQRTTPPTRYHAAPRQQAKQAPPPPPPTYRIQAKITGLERTGKKDPILRFDVYVRRKPSFWCLLMIDIIWS